MRLTHILTAGIAAIILASCEMEEKSDAEKLIAEFRGHAVEFTWQPSGRSNGVEYYYPKANKVLYRNRNGRCLSGRFEVEDNAVTFMYPNHLTATFSVEEREGRLVMVDSNGSYQTHRIVSDDSVGCTPENLD